MFPNSNVVLFTVCHNIMIFEVNNDRIFTSVCGKLYFKCLHREDRVLLTVCAHNEAVAQTVISQKCGDKEGL